MEEESVRRRYRWDPTLKEMVEIDVNARTEQRAPMVIPDIEGYQSPVTGLWVEGRKQRREDLKRTNSRPWEGLAQERKEAARQQAYAEERRDRRLEERLRSAYHQRLTPQQRREVEGR
jgi:hypothetical protein